MDAIRADDTKEARNPIFMSVGRRTVVITRLKYIIIVRGEEGKKGTQRTTMTFTRPIALPTTPRSDQTCSRQSSSHIESCPHPCKKKKKDSQNVS